MAFLNPDIKPTFAEIRKKGRKRHFPRLSRKSLPACEVRNLVKYSPVFTGQDWQCYRIKDGEKGPIVWEVKSVAFYRKEGADGLPKQTHTLIVARNVLNPKEIKYFLANQSLQSPGTTLNDLLSVAFSRWPIERCFEIGKRDLGMDHFEMRQWPGIHRHFYISQLTQLFCGHIQQSLGIASRCFRNRSLGFPGAPGLRFARDDTGWVRLLGKLRIVLEGAEL